MMSRKYVLVTVLFLATTVLAINFRALPNIALSYGFKSNVGGGMLAIGCAIAQTVGLIMAALVMAVTINSAVNVLILSSVAASIAVLRISIFLAAVPLFALIPLWLAITGDGWWAGFAFLTFAILIFLLTTSSEVIHASADVRKLVRIYRPNTGSLLVMAAQFLWWSARGRLITTLAFALPFSVGAELIAGRSSGGLGVLATSAYRYGDFGQLSVLAAAYAVVSLILVGPSSASAAADLTVAGSER